MPSQIRIFIVIYLLYGSLVLNAENQTYNESTEQEYVLFSDMTTPYSIAVSESASSSELWAARELQHWLTEVSRAYFRIVEYSSQDFVQFAGGGPYIFIGYSPAITDSLSIL